jgi:hypothetical protein
MSLVTELMILSLTDHFLPSAIFRLLTSNHCISIKAVAVKVVISDVIVSNCHCFIRIPVISLSCENWRFTIFQLKFWSENWRFFVDVFMCLSVHNLQSTFAGCVF